MPMRILWRASAVLAGIIAAGTVAAPRTIPATYAAEQAKPAISEDASAALLRMGQTLRTVVATLGVCALSLSGAIFLILELDRPFEGVIRVSSAPLRGALAQHGQ